VSISLLIITHDDTGKLLLKNAIGMFGYCPLEVKTLSVRSDDDPDKLKTQSLQMVEELDSGDGVLVLADMCGSTPGNIATSLYQEDKINVLAGINLPMLARIFNYAQLDLAGITDKAISGGQLSIIECKPDR